MFSKKIYSTELNTEVIQCYLKDNIGLKDFVKKYHAGKEDIQKWKTTYVFYGIERLSVIHGIYKGNFKVYLVKYMQCIKVLPQ